MKKIKKLVLAQLVLVLGASSIVGEPVIRLDQSIPLSSRISEKSSLSNTIKFETLDKGKDLVHEFETTLDKAKPYEQGMLFDKPLVVSPGSKLQLDLDLDILETTEMPQYQIVTSHTVPTLPYTVDDWKPIDLTGKEGEQTIIYEDMVETPNTITAQHYLYGLGFEISPADLKDKPRDRSKIFKYPVNGVVQQTADLGDNLTYSTQAGKPAFFRSGGAFDTEGTNLEAVFVPKETGEYRFAMYSATGAIITIEIDGKKVQLCNNFDTHTWKRPQLYGEDVVVHLEAGKRYPMYIKTIYKSYSDLAPCFMYTMSKDGKWPSSNFYNKWSKHYNKVDYMDRWKMVTPDLLIEQNPDNGCARAVKLWGYIVPDVSGEFNFGLLADDGAYGYLVMDNQPKLFVDSFKLAGENSELTNNEVFSLKAGVPYPFYLEWYEGMPPKQALAPRYREPSGEWKDIPSHWFRASKDETVGSTPLAMFYGAEGKVSIDLPYNYSNNYIILKVTDKEDKMHQLIYGPFTGIKSTSMNEISMKTFDEGIKEVHGFTTHLDADKPYEKGMLFEKPFVISPNSDIKLELDLDILETSSNPRYQIVTGDKPPTLPYTEGEWETINVEGKGAEGNIIYKDMMEKPGTITAQHYLYAPSYEISPYDFGLDAIRDRNKIFSEPVNKPVIQHPSLGDNQRYSTQPGKKAFFHSSSFRGSTILRADFVPKVTGEYKFSVYSATGSVGRITVDGKEITFVDNFGVYQERKPNFYAKNVSVYLEAGKSYPMYLQTQYYSKYDTAPVLRYTIKDHRGWPSDFYLSYNDSKYNRYAGKYWPRWKIATPDLLQNQDPTNAAARAVKLWGYIVPDVDGVFNFSVMADDGAYGYIYMDGKPKVFVDSFKITNVTVQTNYEKFALKKGVAYPIYIEWYEGCPTSQALAPRYRVDGTERWIDIPYNWFRGSTNTDVVTEPLAMFYGVEADTRIKLPYNYENNYIILDMKDKTGQNHQVLYGPFTGIKPEEVDPLPLEVESDYNYVVPTSVSNISSKMVFSTPSKAVSYKLNLNSLKDQTLNGKPLFEFPIDPRYINVVVHEGKLDAGGKFNKGSRVPIESYQVDILQDEIKITFKDEEKLIKPGEGYQVDIYFRVNLGNQISYFDKGGYKWYYSTFKDKRYDSSGQIIPDMTIELSCYKKPKIAEPTYSLTTGEMITDEKYSDTLIEEKVEIGLDLKEIPSIS